jgi:hypothetical protein
MALINFWIIKQALVKILVAINMKNCRNFFVHLWFFLLRISSLVIFTVLAPKNGWQDWTRICTPERNRPEFTDRNKTRESEFVRSDTPDVTGSRTRIGVRNFVKSDIYRSNSRSSTTWRRTPSCSRPGSLSVEDICEKKNFGSHICI